VRVSAGTAAAQTLATYPAEPRRRVLLELLRAALAAVDGRSCTLHALRSAPLRNRIAHTDRFWVAAVGKAAARMALGAGDALGATLERVLLITKDGHVDAETVKLPRLEVWESSHPVPDQRSLDAGARLVRFIEEMPATVQPLLLVSGGASSLVEVLVPGASLAALQRLNCEGLSGGLSIEALNARRSELSRIKGGRLAARLGGRGAIALFISDVPGDDPAVIGSGLLGPPPLTAPAGGSPAQQGAHAPADDIERIVVASMAKALGAVRTRAGRLAVQIEPALFGGPTERLAVRFVHELVLGAAQLRVWGGESALELPERPGRGGRNQHLALAAARLIAGHDLFLLAAGTDGTDGPTADAGALVDGGTCARVMCAGLDVDDCLRRADSGSALAAAGDLVQTGPTGTNVGDLVMGLRLSESEARAWLEG
jgi:glycerate 2-kinase